MVGVAWSVGVATVVALLGVVATLPAQILLPLDDPTRHDAGEDTGMGIEEDTPTHLRLQKVYQILSKKRYFGIELPDYIASRQSLGDLREKMKSSGK